MLAQLLLHTMRTAVSEVSASPPFTPIPIACDFLFQKKNPIFFNMRSLMKPQKYAACRTIKENQTISTITNDRDEQRHIGNNSIPHPGIYDGDRLTQVKTYTDHGNGYGQRSGGTTHYSKVHYMAYNRCPLPSIPFMRQINFNFAAIAWSWVLGHWHGSTGVTESRLWADATIATTQFEFLFAANGRWIAATRANVPSAS